MTLKDIELTNLAAVRNMGSQLTVASNSPLAVSDSIKAFRDTFGDQGAKIPPAIITLRGELGETSKGGMFISTANLGDAGWIEEIEEKRIVNHTWNNGAEEQLYDLGIPRMVVMPVSPLLSIQKVRVNGQQTKKYHNYNHELLSDDGTKCGTGRIYNVVLLNANNKPLHENVLSFFPKSTTSRAFDLLLKEVVKTIKPFYQDYVGRKCNMNVMEQAVCVIEPVHSVVMAGTKTKGKASTFEKIKVPITADNWKEFLLISDPEAANWLFTKYFDPKQKLVVPGGENAEIVFDAEEYF